MQGKIYSVHIKNFFGLKDEEFLWLKDVTTCNHCHDNVVIDWPYSIFFYV